MYHRCHEPVLLGLRRNGGINRNVAAGFDFEEVQLMFTGFNQQQSSISCEQESKSLNAFHEMSQKLGIFLFRAHFDEHVFQRKFSN